VDRQELSLEQGAVKDLVWEYNLKEICLEVFFKLSDHCIVTGVDYGFLAQLQRSHICQY